MEEKNDRAYKKATEEKPKNARCPFCGEELYLSLKKGTGVCTKCKRQFDNDKAIKLYEAIHQEKVEEEKSASYGEEYLEVERILQRVDFYIRKKDFSKAKEELVGALKITNTDYRVYFELVRVETKDLTDYRNESHKEYLNKAIEVADKDQKAVIMKLYKDFYQLSKLPDEDINQYKTEENQAIKEKLEEKLKELIPFYMKKEKSLKINMIVFPILLGLGIISFVLSFVFNIGVLIILGACLMFASYFFIRNYVLSKKMIKVFNGYLDFYDALENFDLSVEAKRNILDGMKVCRENFAEKNNSNQIEESIYSLMKIILDSYNQKATEFVKNHKVLSYYANAYEEV